MFGIILPPQCISRLREEEAEREKNREEYDRHKKEWSFEECVARGSLPTGESIEAKFGAGWWSEDGENG